MLARVHLFAVLVGTGFLVSVVACERKAPPAPSADDGHGHDDHAGHGRGPGEHGEAPVGGLAGLIPTSLVEGTPWCTEHGVPETMCTRCDPSLVAKYKASGDWCGGHNLPESQCLLCNPELKVKWAALAPKPAGGNAADEAPSTRRLLTGRNDPLCAVEGNQVKFASDTVVEKAGIRTEAAARRRLSASVECPGEVGFDQTRLAHVTSRVSGMLAEVRGRIGDSVAAGDVLAVVQSTELAEAKSRYIEAGDKLELATLDFERAKRIHEGVKRILTQCDELHSVESMRKAFAEVRIGEVKSRLLTAHSDLELARSNQARQLKLREEGINSERTLEAAQAELESAEARFHAVHEEIAFGSERELMSAEKELRIAKSLLGVAERTLHMLGISQANVEALAGAVDTTLAAYELRSPSAGNIVEQHAVIGEAVDEESALFVVADLSSVWVMMDVAQRELVELAVGQRVLFTVDGMPGHGFEGKLTWISNQIDDRTRTVRARAEFSNGEGLLRANMFGAARIVLHEDEEVLTVPLEAVQSDGCCQLVFVRESETVYHPRKVRLGAQANGLVEIHRGLSEGEVVVTAGSFLMKTEILKGSIGAGCCEVETGR